MCIFMIYIYLRKQVSKWQPVAMPSITSGFNEIYEKVKMAPETCPRGRKHNNKSNNNFWYMYAYVKTYICMIYIYLTKQVNRLKLVRLHTRANDSAKIYTIDKFGTKSSPMARKRIHKFHNILWKAYSYLKRRIMEFDRYLHTRILGWRNQKPLATPPPTPPPPRNWVYKADRNRGVSEWLHPFSLHGKCYVSASKPPILFLYAFV